MRICNAKGRGRSKGQKGERLCLMLSLGGFIGGAEEALQELVHLVRGLGHLLCKGNLAVVLKSENFGTFLAQL